MKKSKLAICAPEHYADIPELVFGMYEEFIANLDSHFTCKVFTDLFVSYLEGYEEAKTEYDLPRQDSKWVTMLLCQMMMDTIPEGSELGDAFVSCCVEKFGLMPVRYYPSNLLDEKLSEPARAVYYYLAETLDQLQDISWGKNIEEHLMDIAKAVDYRLEEEEYCEIDVTPGLAVFGDIPSFNRTYLLISREEVVLTIPDEDYSVTVWVSPKSLPDEFPNAEA